MFALLSFESSLAQLGIRIRLTSCGAEPASLSIYTTGRREGDRGGDRRFRSRGDMIRKYSHVMWLGFELTLFNY